MRWRRLWKTMREGADEAPDTARETIACPMLGVARENHAASSALSAALIDAEFLAKLSRTASDQVREVATELLVSLGRVREHMDATARLVSSCGACQTDAAPMPGWESSGPPAPGHRGSPPPSTPAPPGRTASPAA